MKPMLIANKDQKIMEMFANESPWKGTAGATPPGVPLCVATM